MDRLSLALMLVAAVLVVLTFRGYGVTWDEDVQNWYGNLVLNYYLSLLGEMRTPNWLLLYKYGDLYNYGAVFDMTAAALNRFSPLGVYETRHLLNGFVGILGLAGCWKLGRALGGPRAGFLAALFLLLTPNYYGQMFNNPKDIPFAVGFVWSIYYLVRILPESAAAADAAGGEARRRHRPDDGGAGRRAAAAVLSRADAGPVRPVAGDRRAPGDGADRDRLDRPVARVPAGGRDRLPGDAGVLAMGAGRRRSRIRCEALAVFSHEIFPCKTLFDGALLSATDLPWTYLPTYIGLALPELILALLLAAPVVAAVALFRRGSWQIATAFSACFMLGFSIVFPVAYAIADQGGAVRRHAAFHLCAAADRGRRGAGRRPRAAPARRPALPPAGLCRARALRAGACVDHGHAAPRPVRLLQRLCRRGGRGRSTASSSTIGPIPTPRRCAGWKTICASNTAPISRSASSPSRSAARRSRRGIIFPPNFRPVTQRDRGRFLHRLHQGRLPTAT